MHRYVVRYEAPGSLGGAYTVWADTPEDAYDKVVAMLAGAKYDCTPTLRWAGPGRKMNGPSVTQKRFNPKATVTSVERA